MATLRQNKKRLPLISKLQEILGSSDPAESALDLASPVVGMASRSAKSLVSKLIDHFGVAKHLDDAGFITRDGIPINLGRSKGIEKEGFTHHPQALAAVKYDGKDAFKTVSDTELQDFLDTEDVIRSTIGPDVAKFQIPKSGISPKQAKIIAKASAKKGFVMIDGRTRDASASLMFPSGKEIADAIKKNVRTDLGKSAEKAISKLEKIPKKKRNMKAEAPRDDSPYNFFDNLDNLK